MDVVNKIISDLIEFVEFFKIKYKYDQRGVLKRFRLNSGLNKHLDEENWCDLFIIKSAYNYCAKLLLIKLWEDNKKIACKLNKEGLEEWNKLVTNIPHYYGKLYEIAELDMLESEDMKNVFKQTDYDIYKMDDELSEFIIDRLKAYDFNTFSYKEIYQIYNSLYTDEKRFDLNLQYFYKPAKPIDFILSMKIKTENLI